MRCAPRFRRPLALLAATALLTTGGVASGLLTSTATAAPSTGTVSPSSAINRYADQTTTSTPLKITIPGGGFSRSNTVSVQVFRAADVSDVLANSGAAQVSQPLANSTTSDTVTQAVVLSRANPGPYSVKVFDSSNAASPVLLGSCSSCFTVLAYAPECTSFVGSGGQWAIKGQNFPKTTYLRFLAPGQTAVSDKTKDDLGLVAKYTTSSTAPAPTDTSITYDLDTSAALGGSHLIVIRNTADQFVQCAGTHTVPRGHLFADAVPNRPVPTLGLNSTKVPFTVAGDAVGNPGLSKDVTVKVGVFFGNHNGVTTSVTSVDATGMHVSFSADKTAAHGLLDTPRSITYVAPDGGEFEDVNGLNVALNPGIDNSQSTSVGGSTGTKPSPGTIGQGARAIPVVVNVPYDSSGNPINLYDGAGLAASFGNVPGLSVRLDPSTPFLDAPDSDGYHQRAQLLVSTIGTNADGSVVRPAPGTYTLGTQNADGGTSLPGPANQNKDDGSCAGCFTVATGPIISTVSPSNVNAGANVSLTISGTGFIAPSLIPGSPAPSTVLLTPALINQAVTVNNATSITVTGQVPAPAANAPQPSVTVTNPGNKGTDTCGNCLTINGLSVGAPSPSSVLNQGTATLTIPGTFATDSTVQLERTGYPAILGTVSSTSPSMVAAFPLDLAAPGFWTVRVNSAGNTGFCQNCLQIIGAQPTFTSESPSGGHPGARIDLQIVGDFFARGTTADFSLPQQAGTQGITVLSGAFVTDRRHLTVPLLVSPSATSGPKTFTIVNADGQKLPPSQVPTFTVQAAPGASSVSPSSRSIGSGSFVLTITGSNLSNVKSVQITGSGLTTGVPTTAAPTANSTSVTVPVDIAPAETSTAARDVVLTNDDGSTATCASCFALIAAPTVKTITPALASPGDSNKQVTVTGTGFGTSPTLNLGPAVTIGAVVASSDTSLTAAISVDTSALRGLRDVVVTNTAATSGGKGTLQKGFAIATLPAVPSSLIARSDDSVVHLSWTETDDGGSPITKYTVLTKQGSTTVRSTDVTGTAADIGALANGTVYTFTVTATNALGTSAASAPIDATPASVPGAPQNVVANAADAGASVTWIAPASTGGSAITSYTVTVSPSAGTVTYPTDRTQPGAMIAGLTNGTTYTFGVAASNAVGTGPSANSNAATPAATSASAPSSVAVDVSRAAGTADLTWSPPATSTSPLTSYTVRVVPNNGTITYPTNRTSTGAVVTGLTNGTQYAFTVVANNAGGASPPSNTVNATPYDIPAVVRNLTGSTNGSTGAVTWDAPASDGGRSIVRYTMTVSPSSGTTVVYPTDRTLTGATINGLTAGTSYSVTVVAENPRGSSVPTSFGPLPGSVTVPTQPRTPTATAGDTQATVSWTAPSSDGGSPVTGYTVTSSPGGISKAVGNVLTATVTGLTNGTTYSFTVIATNAKGNSPSSAATNAVTPSSAPPPPPSGDPSFTINTGTIRVGQCATLKVFGPANDQISVLVKGAKATAFTKIKTLIPGQSMAICPSTNSVYQVSDANKVAPQKTLLVKAIQTLVVNRSGSSAAFSGHVIPGVVSRLVIVYFYVDGGHVENGGVGTVKAGGNFSFAGTVRHPGRLVHFFAQTYADDYNTAGRSPLVTVQY